MRFDDDDPYEAAYTKKTLLHELIHVITSKYLFAYEYEKGYTDQYYEQLPVYEKLTEQ